MFKFVVALICLAGPAHAGPVIAGISAVVGAVTTFAASSALAGFAVNLVGSLLLSAAATALRGSQKIGIAKQQLRVPQSLVSYRFWYGETLCIPSPLQCGVENSRIYGCVLLNSRPSEDITTIYLDNRPLVLTGDLFDLDVGAEATNGNFADQVVKFWVGMGDQTAPPAQLVSEMPSLFLSTDAWQGRTVLWYKIALGNTKRAAKMWKSRPPEISVLGQWSKVYDPTDVGQDPDDATTWTFSRNQGLCLLDCYRQNPIKQFPLTGIHLASFAMQQTVSDQAVSLAAGGTEPRYCVDGVVVFDGGELEAIMQPLHDAGASRVTWIGGQIGVVPGGPLTSSYTVADVLDGMEYTRYQPADQMITTVRCSYTSADRTYELAELEPYVIPGAAAADGGLERVANLELGLVQSPTQAMRLQKITGQRGRMQRQISTTLPPDAFDLVAGSVVTVDLPAPFDGRNGTYEVTAINPTVSILGDDGQVALRCPATVQEYAATIFDWTTAEEQDVVSNAFDPDPVEIDDPGAVTVLSGAGVALDIGTTIVPRIRFSFDPSTTDAVDGYEWQYQIVGDDWTAGGMIDADVRDGSSDVFGFLSAVTPGTSYVIRVRARWGLSASDWVTSSSVVAVAGVARYEADYENAVYAINGVTGARSNVLSLTRASTGTYVDSGGTIQTAAVDAVRFDYTDGTRALLVEPAATNICLYSAQVDNGTWIKNGGTTVTANTVASPDGTTTADTVTSGNAAGQGHYQQITVTASTQYTMSFWVQLGTMAAASFKMAVYNVTAGSFIAFDVVPSVTPSSSVWKLITYSFTTPAGCTSILLWPFRNNAAVTGTFYIWGAQLELGAVATSYIATGAASASRSADVATMQGITATLDLLATYGDGTTAAFSDAPVIPGYWPALTKTRLRELIGTI